MIMSGGVSGVGQRSHMSQDMSVFTRPMRLGIPQAGLAESPAHGPERLTIAAASGDMDGFNIRRRFWVSAALSLPLVILALSVQAHGLEFNILMSPTSAGFLALVLATAVVLWGGWPLLVAGRQSIATRRPSLVALVGVAVTVTYLYGVIATLFPNTVAIFAHPYDRLPLMYLGAAAVMTLLALLGRFLAIDADDRMSMAVSDRSRASRRNELVVAAPRRSGRSTQDLPGLVSGVFIAVVMSAAAATFIVWTIWGPAPVMAYALMSTVVVLIIACPCALGLAKPASFAVVAARAANADILFESRAAIEAMHKVDTLVIEKMGILTDGRLRLATVEPTNPSGDLEFLRLAASLEQSIEDPLASAIVSGARERGLELSEAGRFEEIPGGGVHGTVERQSVVVGNHSLVKGRAALSENAEARADQLCANGQTVLFVAVDGVVVGLLGVANPVKKDAQEVIWQLQAEGMDTVMITGDRRATAEAIARPLGVDRVHSEVLPDEKVAVVQRIQDQGRTVAVVRNAVDGVSAAARTDVGREPGTGTNEMTDGTGVTLAGGDLWEVLRARRLSRATMRNVQHSELFALIFTGLGVPIAAGVLYPAVGWLLGPMIAVATMTVGSVVVIGNALRLRRGDFAAPRRFANQPK